MIPVFLINLYSTAIIVISYLIVCYSIADCQIAAQIVWRPFYYSLNFLIDIIIISIHIIMLTIGKYYL